jgi:predicted ester cyclase
LFNKEKRQQAKATKEYLKTQIKPRPSHSQMQEKKAGIKERQDVIDKREEPIRDRLKAIHAGEATGGDIAQMGCDLLYIGNLSNIHFQVQDQFSIPEKAMTRWTVHGLHDKEFLGMAPTGREVSFSGITVSYFSSVSKGGVVGSNQGGEATVTQEYHYWDMVALLQQIQAA